MTKAELESKHLSELHSLAAEAGVERFRMLTRAELIDRLADGDSGGDSGSDAPARKQRPPRKREGGRERSGREDRDKDGQAERPARRRRRSGRGTGEGSAEAKVETSVESAPPEDERSPEPESAAAESSPASAAEESGRPRRRRRRRFGRRGKQGVTLQSLLLPPEAGRQAVLAAESREACTALLRSVAADLAADSKGPDPIALLIDPSPEELADWKRDAPQAEIVAAGQARHADDALEQAKARAGKGEDIILLVDSLTRLAEAHGDADAAKDFFDAGRGDTGSGSLTVVAALERS
jgi:transcription termination factor Rho